MSPKISGFDKIVRELIDAKADINLSNDIGSALYWAVFEGKALPLVN